MGKMSLFTNFSNKMDAPTLDVALDELGLGFVDLAIRLDVDRKTVERWHRGETPIPGSVALLLRVAVHMAQMMDPEQRL